MAGENGESAVELLGEDDAGELMGQGDASEGEEKVGALARGGRPAVRGADGQDEMLRAAIAESAETFGELRGSELAALGVEEDGVRGRAARLTAEPVEEGGLGLEELAVAWSVVGGAFKIGVEETVGRFGLGSRTAGDDGCEGDLHVNSVVHPFLWI